MTVDDPRGRPGASQGAHSTIVGGCRFLLRASRSRRKLIMADETRVRTFFPPNIRWTGNVRPVDPETEAGIIRQYVGGQRVALPKPWSPCHMADVKHLTPNALLVLSLFAQGSPITPIANRLRTHREHIVRILKWAAVFHGLTGPVLRGITFNKDIPNAIRELAAAHAAPATA
jgi:hypothetical protein